MTTAVISRRALRPRPVGQGEPEGDEQLGAGSVLANVAGEPEQMGRWLFVPTFLIYGAIVGVVGDLLLGRTGDSRSPATTS